MDVLQVAVATRRRPKLNAVWEALTVIVPLLDPAARFEVISIETRSPVRPTPLSRQETMEGAWGRAEQLRRQALKDGHRWQYFVGLEGGLDVWENRAKRLVFLENWACVLNRSGEEGWGHSGGILLPEALAEMVIEQGIELADAIDRFAGGCNLRDTQGAWGVLSANLITRQDAFRLAVLSAFAPFYNARVYVRLRTALGQGS
jgi:inosine/xanthosine triphosphatase